MSANKKFNYNYAFVFYDVNEKRVAKIFKICKKYLVHYQKSVFRGDITPSKLIALKNELKKIIVEDEDFVCIVKLLNGNVFGEEVMGISESSEDLFLQPCFTRRRKVQKARILLNKRFERHLKEELTKISAAGKFVEKWLEIKGLREYKQRKNSLIVMVED